MIDSLPISDSKYKSLHLTRRLDDPTALTESLIRQIAGLVSRDLSDKVVLTDSINSALFLLVSRVLISQIDIDELQRQYLLISRGLIQQVDLAEFISREIGKAPVLRLLVDQFALNDNVSSELYQLFTRVLIEYLEVVDQLSRILLLTRELSESVTPLDFVVSEFTSGAIVLSRIVESGFDISGSMWQAVQLNRLVQQSVWFTDVFIRNYKGLRELRDNIIIDDILFLELLRLFVRNLEENVDLSESIIARFISALKDIGYIHHAVVAIPIDMQIRAITENFEIIMEIK